MSGGLTFRVLGPLEVERDGALIRLGSPKLRGTIALLLIRAGESVSAEVLIDSLWGEAPPPTARTALQGHISKIRKLLGGQATASLETREAGYILHVDPERLDLRFFEDLAEDGRLCLARGEIERARELLGRALELWRGHPLEDIDLPSGPLVEVRHLEERYLAVVEGRIEADLGLGRHMEIISELEGLLSAQPLSERLHALAALALYRSGRQADALDVCRRIRLNLSGELGLEPGPIIERLEADILNHASSLDLSPSPAAMVGSVWEGRKVVTALVCLASASAGTASDPEARRFALGPLLERATDAIHTHGGAIRESLAGRLVALFGLESSHEDDALRALAASSDIHALVSRERLELEIRAGVATGEVLMEDASGQRSLLSTDPVDSAGRLASAARAGETLLTQSTFRLAHPSVGAEPTQLLLLDDDSAPIVAFRLQTVASPGSPRLLRSPLVGREAELALLRQAFERAANNNLCSLVSLLGPPGIGKSRLVTEFVRDLPPGTRVLTGRCPAYGSGITLFPIAQVVRQAAGITEDDEKAEAKRKIASLVAGRDDAGFLADQAAAVLGLTDGSPEPGEGFWAIRKVFEAVAGEGPTLIVIDDLHWAHPPLLDVVEHIASWSQEVPLMLVCLGRPELMEARPGWGGGRVDSTTMSLRGLPEQEAALLLGHLLKDRPIVNSVRDAILAAAEGNPLFLEELVGMLIEHGALALQGGTWAFPGNVASMPIPPTIQALVAARLDRLAPEERRLAEHAAVVGREFTEEDVTLLADRDEVDLRSILERLIAKDLLVPAQSLQAWVQSYRFRHVMIRDVVYQAASKQVRAADHERFGNALDDKAADRVTETDELIGFHLEAAYRYRRELRMNDDHTKKLRRRAAVHMVSAGQRAFSREDMSAATSLLRRALSLLGADDAQHPDLYWRLGVALLETGQMSEAEEVLERGLELAVQLRSEDTEWRLRLEREETRLWRDPASLDTREAERLAASAIDVFQRLGDKSGLARAYRLVGDAISRRGHLEEAFEAFERSRSFAMEAGDEREASQRPNLGVVHSPVPAERCIEIVRQSLDRSHRPDPEGLAGLGLVLAMAGKTDEAWEVLEQGLSRARDLGAELSAASIGMHHGAALLIANDPLGAEVVLRPAVEALQAMGERNMMSTAMAFLAEAFYRQGKLDEAMVATLVSEDATGPDDPASQMAWRGVRAKVLAARGELRQAEQIAREGVSIADGTDFLNMVGDAHLDLALVLETCSKRQEAEAAAGRALEAWEAKGNVLSADRARSVIARLRRSVGKRDSGADQRGTSDKPTPL